MSIRTKAGLAAALAALALPTAASARSVYVTNNTDGTVSTFAADPGTGVLSPDPAPTTGTGNGPEGVALTPDARYLYVADRSGPTVSGYSVAASGALTELPGSPFPAGGAPSGLSATADGRFLYVAEGGGGGIRGFAIGSDGALTPLPGSPWSTGPGSITVATSPDSKLLYAVDEPGNDLDGFAIGEDGSLTPLAATMPALGPQPYGLAFTPDGRRLYVSNLAPAGVYGFVVAADGALTAPPGSPYAVNDAPYGSLAISPDGKNLYVPGYNAGDMGAYSIAADGSLAAVTGSPYPSVSRASGAGVSPDGRFVYTVGWDTPANVGAFARAADGTLTPVAGSPFTSGGTGADIQPLAITPNRSPRARIKVVPGSPSVGERVRFNAEESVDNDGTIASYAWRFGAGDRETTTTPIARHTYRRPGTYTATLTVTDSEGCSTKPVYTGQTASCEGSTRAVATRTFEVVDREVAKPKIKADETQRQSGAEIKVAVRAGAAEPVDVVATGTLKIKGQGKHMALTKVKKSVRAKKDKKLKLWLKRGMAANFKVSRALQANRRVDATVKVRMRDAAGNTFADSLKIRLK